MDVHITNEGAKLEHRAAMRFLTVVIVIMRQRTIKTLKGSLDMIFHAMKFNMSFVHFVALNKSRSGKFASTAVFVWVNTSAKLANSMMTIHKEVNTTATAVGFAELEGVRIFSIATSVVVTRCI
ncbi:hypothetical protein IFM89_031493 [Coptis chinensis]|uniref:Uncharacterized protein n=1 Tax=Coptis chinensis TaxID=261450 RepID=A0A835LL15_9MAGN|nr:hypothetical protein IFM89_031493 [Coptis chinensis]